MIYASYHKSDAIASEAVGQKFGQLAVPVNNKNDNAVPVCKISF